MRKRKKKKQKQKLAKQRISRTAENQPMGVQVKNPDLTVRRGGVILFYFFFKSKTCLSPGYHQQAPYGLFCCTSRNKADRLPISFACLLLGTPSRARRVRVACENIRCSSLFAAGNVSRETSPAAKSEEKRWFFAF